MSFTDGWAAINLDKPKRVPRAEYSVFGHWDLIGTVTGVAVDAQSPEDVKRRAREKFMRTWDFDFMWSIMASGGEFGDMRTKMGHAEYAAGGADRNDEVSCPFESPEDVLAFRPMEVFGQRDRAGLVRRFDEHYARCCADCPDQVNMTGIYVTLVSGLIEIFGWDMLLLAAGTDPAGFGAVADRYAEWVQQYFDALAECTAPLIMVHDDIVWTAGPFLAPDWYRQYVFPNYRRLLRPLLDAGKKIAYTSDGNYTMFIDDIADAGVSGFVLEPLTDMKYIADKYGATHFFVGNADTRVLLSGTREQIEAEVRRCMDIGKDCPGFFMAVGNHIPSNTPVENAIYYNRCYEEMSRR